MRMFVTLFFLSCNAVLLSSCQPKEPSTANKKQDAPIAILKYQSFADGFDLLSLKNSHEYEGSMLIWNKNLAPELVEKALKFAKKIRRHDIAFKKMKFLDDEEYEKSCANTTQYLELSQTLPKISTKTVLAFYAEQANHLFTTGERWFRSILAPEKSADFATYCETLIWEQAFLMANRDSLYAKYNTINRPSPLYLCEDYYKNNGFFSDSSCEVDEEGKDYSPCFFSETGIWRSNIVLEQNKNPIAPKDLSEVKKKFSDPIWLSEFVNSKDGKSLKSGIIRFPDGKKYVLTAKKMNITSWWKKDLASFTTRPNEGKISLLRNLFLDLENSDYTISANDLLANIFLFVDNNSEINFLTPRAENVFELERNKIPELLGKKVSSKGQEKNKKINQELKDIKSRLEDIKNKRISFNKQTQWLAKRDQWLAKKAESKAYLVQKNSVSLLQPNIYLQLINIDANLIVLFNLEHNNGKKHGKNNTFAGCFEEEQVSCTKTLAKYKNEIKEVIDLLASALPMRLNFTKESQKLSFEIEIFDSERLGLFQNIDPADSRFQAFASSFLQGKILRFELFPARQSTKKTSGFSLNILTGKVFLEDTLGRELALGSVNLTESGNLSNLFGVIEEFSIN